MRMAIHLDCAWCGPSGGPAGESEVLRDMEPPGFHVSYDCQVCGFHNTIEIELGFMVHLSDTQKRVLQRAINEAAKEQAEGEW